MTRILALLLLGALVLPVLACASNKSESGAAVLHFTGRDETESNFRGRIRTLAGQNSIGLQGICTQIRGLPPKEAVPLLASPSNDEQVFAGSTPRPGQKAGQKDLERSAAIVQEECTRMFLK